MIKVLDEFYLALAILICIGWQLCFFLIAIITRSDHVTDFAYGTNFVVLAAILYGLSQFYDHARQIIILSFVTVWGLRLAFYLLARVIKEGRDYRFDGVREHFGKFAAFWLWQTCTVWIVSVPFILFYSSIYQPGMGWRDGIGIGLFAIGFLIEVIADIQKFVFKSKIENKNKLCVHGLWRYSRHPNYFGEALVWWGIWSICTSVFDFNRFFYFSIFSPLYLTLSLLFLSGIPSLEIPWNKKYGADPEYILYKNQTSPFIPFIPSLYAKLPRFVKIVFFFDYPFYDKGLPIHSGEIHRNSAERLQPQVPVDEAWGKSTVGVHNGKPVTQQTFQNPT